MNELGIRAALVSITPNCRAVERGGQMTVKAGLAAQHDKDDYALERAVELIRSAYKQSLEGWRGQGKEPVFNLALYVERPEPA